MSLLNIDIRHHFRYSSISRRYLSSPSLPTVALSLAPSLTIKIVGAANSEWYVTVYYLSYRALVLTLSHRSMWSEAFPPTLHPLNPSPVVRCTKHYSLRRLASHLDGGGPYVATRSVRSYCWHRGIRNHHLLSTSSSTPFPITDSNNTFSIAIEQHSQHSFDHPYWKCFTHVGIFTLVSEGSLTTLQPASEAGVARGSAGCRGLAPLTRDKTVK